MTGSVRPEFSPNNPFAPKQQEFSPNNPFAPKQAHPSVAPGPEPDNLLEIAGKSTAQALLTVPRSIAGLGAYLSPDLVGDKLGFAQARKQYDALINSLEPEIGPNTSPTLEAFARNHPNLNEFYRGLTFQSTSSRDQGIQSIPGDLQALAATGGEIAGTFGAGYGEFKGVGVATELAGKGFVAGAERVAPRLAAKASARISQAARAASNLAATSEGAAQIVGTVKALPRQLATGVGQQYLANEGQLDAKDAGAGVLVGFLGALGEGAWLSRNRPGYSGDISSPAGDIAPTISGSLRAGEVPPGPQPAPRPRGSPTGRPIKELTDFEVVQATPAEIGQLAKSAKVEQTGQIDAILGPVGRRLYLRSLRIAASPQSSPEAASTALATIERQRAQLDEDQRKTLDEVGKKGYTPARLRRIAEEVKDYTPEIVSSMDVETLQNQFGEVLMEKGYGKNVSGIYRLHRLYNELESRGVGGGAIVKPVIDYMVENGVERSQAVKAVVNRMVEITGDMEKIKENRKAADPGIGRVGLDEDVTGVMDEMARTGPNTVGSAIDRSLYKKLGQNMYKGDLATVVVKEGLQNSIDAVKGLGKGGKIHFTLDEPNSRIVVDDNGTGMTPEIAQNQFMNVGGSGKSSATSAGGYGLAKVGLIMAAKHFRMVTVADTPEGPTMTRIEGSADDWIDGTLQYESIPFDPMQGIPPWAPEQFHVPGAKGTSLDITFEEGTKLSWGTANELLTKAISRNRSGATITGTRHVPGVTASGRGLNVLPTRDSGPTGTFSQSTPLADLDYVLGPERSYETWIDLDVLNNGSFQFTDRKYNIEGKGLPKYVVVDVKSKVGVDEADYPFTTSREDLKGPVKDAIDQFFAGIKNKAGRGQVDKLRQALLEAVNIGSSSQHVLLAPGIDPSFKASLAQAEYVQEMALMLDVVTRTITKRVQEKYPEMLTPRFAGISLEKNYLGVNIRASKINELAEESGAEKLPYDTNLIFYNPYATYAEVKAEAIETGDDPAALMAEQAWGTMLHEVVHQIAGGHNEAFTGPLTRLIGQTTALGAKIMPDLQRMFAKAFLGGLTSDYDAISTSWSETIFGKVSGHQDSDLPRLSEGSDQTGHTASVSEALASSGSEGRPLSRGAVGKSKSVLPPKGSQSANAGGTAEGRQGNIDPVGAANSERGPSLKRLGIDPFETRPVEGLQPFEQHFDDQIIPGPRPERVESTWFTPTERAIANVVDRFHALKKFEKVAGGDIPVEKSPYVAARMSSGIAGKVHQFTVNAPFIMKPGGEIEFTGNVSLAQALVPMRGRLPEFRRTAVAVAAQILHAQGKETGFDPRYTDLVVANAKPEVITAVHQDMAQKRDATRYGREFGLFDEEMLNVLDFLGQSMVSWERVFDHSSGGGGKRYSAMNVGEIGKVKDNPNYKLVDPIQTSVDFVRRVMRASDLNRIGLLMVEWAEQRPEALKGVMEPAARERNVAVSGDAKLAIDARAVRKAAKEAGMDMSSVMAKEVAAVMSDSNLQLDGDKIVVRRNGKGEMWKVSPEIGEMFRSLAPQEMHFLVRMIGSVSQVAKAGITLDPSFAVVQAFIGSFHSAMQSKNGFRLGVDSMVGLKHILTTSPQYQKFLAAGGAFGSIGAAEVSAEAAFRAVLPKTVGQRGAEVVMHPLEALRKLLQPLNEMNQMGEFIRATGRGKSSLESGLDGKSVDTDFSVTGLKMQSVAHMFHFLGPYVQGTTTFVKTFTRKPNAWQFLALAGITLPSIYLWYAAEDDQEVRDMQLSPQGQTHWILRIGGQIVKIRKPVLWGALFGNTAELALQTMKGDTPELYEIFGKGLKDQVLFQGMPAIAQLGVGLYFNKDPLTGAQVVPETLNEQVEDKYQTGGNASEVANAVGEAFNMSPDRIDFAIRSLTGTAGAQATKAADWILPNGEISRPTPVSADWPILSRFFVRYPSGTAEPLHTFYERATKLEKVAKTAQLLESKITTSQTGEVYKKYIEEHKNELALAPVYAATREELMKFRQAIRENNGVPDKVLSRERKREIDDSYLRAMILVARQTNTAINLSKLYKP